MKRLALLALAAPLWAQASSFCVAGGSFLPQSSPKPTGFEACAALLSANNQIWSITGNQLNITSQRKIQAVAFSGFATVCHSFAFMEVFCFGAPGGATTGTGASLALTGGFIAAVPVRKGKLGYFMPGYTGTKTNAGTSGTVIIGWGYRL